MSIEVWIIQIRPSQCWNCHPPHRTQSQIQRQNNFAEGQPWVQADHSSVRFLWLMLQKIRKFKCMEMSNWIIWPSAFDCSGRKQLFLPAWWPVSLDLNPRQYSSFEEIHRSSPWGANVWFTLVGPWRSSRLGNEPSRSRLHLWAGHCWAV